MNFWNPVKLSEDNQLELDKRVILNIAEKQLRKELAQVEKKLEKHMNTCLSNRNISIKRNIANNLRADDLAFEKNTILRRLDIITEARRKQYEL